jgi:hypothetical protein
MRKIIMPSVEDVLEYMRKRYDMSYITKDVEFAVDITLTCVEGNYVDTGTLPENTTCVGCTYSGCMSCSRLNNHRVDNYRKA